MGIQQASRICDNLKRSESQAAESRGMLLQAEKVCVQWDCCCRIHNTTTGRNNSTSKRTRRNWGVLRECLLPTQDPRSAGASCKLQGALGVGGQQEAAGLWGNTNELRSEECGGVWSMNDSRNKKKKKDLGCNHQEEKERSSSWGWVMIDDDEGANWDWGGEGFWLWGCKELSW